METNKTKTHYRKVFKSDHLGIADLEDFIEEKVELHFTIKEVKQYVGKLDNGKVKGRISVAGKEIDANIAYFIEDIKPLVLNATNSKVLKVMTGSSFVEDWKNLRVELFIDSSVKMKGEVVGGVRIKPGKATLKEGTPAYQNALKYYKETGNFIKVEERLIVPKEIKEKIISDSLIPA